MLRPFSNLETAPVGEPVSVHSSLDWDAMTTPGVTFRVVLLVNRVVGFDVVELGEM